MAKARRNFFNTPWDERSKFEKGAIIVGTTAVTVTAIVLINKAIKRAQMPPRIDPGSTSQNEFRYDPRPLVDKIAGAIVGTNWLMIYPEIVNQLTQLTDSELRYADQYWRATYGGGNSLRSYIEGEWDAGAYDPAEQRLKAAGL